MCQQADTLQDACVQLNSQPQISRSKPLLSYTLAEDKNENRTLTGLGCLKPVQNIIVQFTALRSVFPPRGFALSDEDVVLMVFVELYHNINLSFLALLFSVHRTEAASIVINSICMLARVLAEASFFFLKRSLCLRT